MGGGGGEIKTEEGETEGNIAEINMRCGRERRKKTTRKERYGRKGTKKMSLERERLNRGEGGKRDKYRDRT